MDLDTIKEWNQIYVDYRKRCFGFLYDSDPFETIIEFSFCSKEKLGSFKTSEKSDRIFKQSP